jgi:hypothetical protein
MAPAPQHIRSAFRASFDFQRLGIWACGVSHRVSAFSFLNSHARHTEARQGFAASIGLRSLFCTEKVVT